MFHGLAPPAFALAAGLVFLMGLAIQRGTTCLVAAITQIVATGRSGRLLAILGAGLLAGTLLWLAHVAGLAVPAAAMAMPGPATVAGGILLGIGAMVNGACVFGSVARFGSGERVFALTAAGYVPGAFVASRVPGLAASVETRPVDLSVGPLLALGLLLLVAAWLVAGRRAGAAPSLVARAAASPAAATCLIGATFAPLLLIAGPWTWPELASDLVINPAMAKLFERVLLLLALFLGATWGGHSLRLRAAGAPPAVTAEQVTRCLAGGFLLAVGASLVPGANDGLLLLGLPFLLTHALVALGFMGATIATLLVATRAAERNRAL